MKICKLLIQNIENKSPKDKFGDTPLYWANSNGHLKVVEILRDFELDISSSDERASGSFKKLVGQHRVNLSKTGGEAALPSPLVTSVLDEELYDLPEHLSLPPISLEDSFTLTPVIDNSTPGKSVQKKRKLIIDDIIGKSNF